MTVVCESCGVAFNVFLYKDGGVGSGVVARALAGEKINALRRGSFFEGSKLSFKTILCLIHALIYKLPYDFVRLELNIGSRHTVVDWFNFYREVCC